MYWLANVEHRKLSEAMAGYIQDTDKGKERLDGGDPSLRAAQVCKNLVPPISGNNIRSGCD